ncbi:MAG: WD40 repeat domain-containing protein [Moorea sp. SIO3C2]|nr:WD40 repeat domain-containing protein [Moorena sp. SIO3C2]
MKKIPLAILGTVLGIMTVVTSTTYARESRQGLMVAAIPEMASSQAQSWRTPQLVRTIQAHSTAVDALSFSPSGRVLLSGGSRSDAHLKLWWLKTGREIDSLRVHQTSVSDMAFSADGTILASVGEDGGVNLWQWNQQNYTGDYTRTFLGHRSNLLSLAMTSDSKVLVTGGLDGIRVWDLRNQRPLYTLANFDHPTYSLALHPKAETLVSGLKNGTIKIWNLNTGQPLYVIRAHQGITSALAFTPNGRTLVSSGYDGNIRVWDTRTWQLKYTLAKHTGKIRAIAINPVNGTILASASRDGVRLWNLNTGKQIAWLTGHQDWVQSVAFSRDGRFLATGGFDRTINIWQANTTEVALTQ